MKLSFLITNLVILFFCSAPAFAGATALHPGTREGTVCIIAVEMPADTIVPAPKPAEGTPPGTEEKRVTAVVKEVPKARKVSAPKQVAIKVKPVKVIKPKIIKPAIKIL
jgi:hypothetical protein